jgi:hypothetical protein
MHVFKFRYIGFGLVIVHIEVRKSVSYEPNGGRRVIFLQHLKMSAIRTVQAGNLILQTSAVWSWMFGRTVNCSSLHTYASASAS